MSAVFDEATERGKITWHCSEEDSGPDVGLSLGLGGNRVLWVGEITNAAWSEGGEDVAALGTAGGWWMILYEPESRVLGKFVDAEEAREFIERMSATIVNRTCRICGCTDHDCSGCIERTGEPCHWIAADLCSACEGVSYA